VRPESLWKHLPEVLRQEVEEDFAAIFRNRKKKNWDLAIKRGTLRGSPWIGKLEPLNGIF
jgi:hypothetical protein